MLETCLKERHLTLPPMTPYCICPINYTHKTHTTQFGVDILTYTPFLSKRKFVWASRPKERVQVFTAGNVLYKYPGLLPACINSNEHISTNAVLRNNGTYFIPVNSTLPLTPRWRVGCETLEEAGKGPRWW